MTSFMEFMNPGDDLMQAWLTRNHKQLNEQKEHYTYKYLIHDVISEC